MSEIGEFSGGVSEGKASRGIYWKPKLTKRQWDLLTPKLDQELETTDNFIDQNTKWLYADSKGTKVFAVYGIGDGTEATVLYAVGGAKAESMNARRVEYESNIYGSERNAYKKNLERLGVEPDQYGNGINRNGQNVSRAVSGVGSVLTGQRRGDNRGAIPSDSEQGKYSGKLETKYSRESGLIDYINQKSGREVDNLSKQQQVAKIRSELSNMKVGTGEIMAINKVADKMFEEYGRDASGRQ